MDKDILAAKVTVIVDKFEAVKKELERRRYISEWHTNEQQYQIMQIAAVLAAGIKD